MGGLIFTIVQSVSTVHFGVLIPSMHATKQSKAKQSKQMSTNNTLAFVAHERLVVMDTYKHWMDVVNGRTMKHLHLVNIPIASSLSLSLSPSLLLPCWSGLFSRSA